MIAYYFKKLALVSLFLVKYCICSFLFPAWDADSCNDIKRVTLDSCPLYLNSGCNLSRKQLLFHPWAGLESLGVTPCHLSLGTKKRVSERLAVEQWASRKIARPLVPASRIGTVLLRWTVFIRSQFFPLIQGRLGWWGFSWDATSCQTIRCGIC